MTDEDVALIEERKKAWLEDLRVKAEHEKTQNGEAMQNLRERTSFLDVDRFFTKTQPPNESDNNSDSTPR